MHDCDVIVVGAGPAGSVAATILARAGVRVRLIDRAAFPRPKLCGDTVNPGTLAILRRLGLAHTIDDRGLRVDGMRVTSADGFAIEGRYPAGVHGRALVRRDLDWALLQDAMAATVQFEPVLAVRRALVDSSAAADVIKGVIVGGNGGERELRAPVTVAADGRQSTLAFSLGLVRHPARPRRWAIGAYYDGAAGLSSVGEMHIRPGRYIGVAPVPGGLANLCVVKPSGPGDEQLRRPTALLNAEIADDPHLRERFAEARLVQPPVVLGPLAVDATRTAFPGLILAGDAAGFIDPMTGDGLRFAVRGGVLAAAAALEALERGWTGVHERLAAARRREFGAKWRFNRTVRAIVESASAVRAATVGAHLAPAVLRAMIAIAGDCRICRAVGDTH